MSSLRCRGQSGSVAQSGRKDHSRRAMGLYPNPWSLKPHCLLGKDDLGTSRWEQALRLNKDLVRGLQESHGHTERGKHSLLPLDKPSSTDGLEKQNRKGGASSRSSSARNSVMLDHGFNPGRFLGGSELRGSKTPVLFCFFKDTYFKLQHLGQYVTQQEET